ncbi:hypothetical protein OS493_008259 [Desmophyllum pertusum]|uniref:Uncharacterized protein n=1 Tax=Desmophyllum pertusum TaxID=174260 RepID=A0A9X0DAY1_9CNID|nr:hypothetical protein OS493_008259 [Desmophyllum pertusum]
MPKYGLSRFLLFIANIEPQNIGGNAVSVGCFLFEESGTNHRKVLQGRFHLLPNESPFRSKCLTVLGEGAECINRDGDVRSLQRISNRFKTTFDGSYQKHLLHINLNELCHDILSQFWRSAKLPSN